MADLSGVWPRERPRPHESDGEATVYDTLKSGLPEGWVAWHSLKIRSHEGDEGEGDFVIAAPGHGIIIVEVKDGRISVRDGQWYQNGHLMKKPPRVQALRYGRLLNRRLNDCRCRAPYAIVTVFPDTPSDDLPTQDDVRGRIFVGQSLPAMCEVLERDVDRMIADKFGPPSGNWIEMLHLMWGETWLPGLSLGNRHERNEERRIRMDNVQRCLLDQTEKTRQALIFGMAGSGKTMLAREKAIHATREGRKVLVLCFTDPLAAGLSNTLREHGIPAETVRRYAKNLLKTAGRPDWDGSSPEFWNGVCARAANEALPPPDRLPDLVVIDEAQDFDDTDWSLVEKLCRRDDGVCDCWAFCDMTQRYWPDRELPAWLGRGMVFDLENNYRCPPSIMALARMVVGDIPAMDGSMPIDPAKPESETQNLEFPEDLLETVVTGIEAGVIKIIETRDVRHVTKTVETEVSNLLKAGLHPGDIAVLSLAGKDAPDSITRQQKMFAGKVLFPADHRNAVQSLVVDTYLRFKGLERAAVIVTDFHLPSTHKNLPVRLFIAMTRAQDFLRIVIPASDLDRIPALRAAASGKALGAS